MTAELLELAAECLWRRDYPNGGSIVKKWDDNQFHDKEIYRKEAARLAVYFAQGARVRFVDKFGVLQRGVYKHRRDMPGIDGDVRGHIVQANAFGDCAVSCWVPFENLEADNG